MHRLMILSFIALACRSDAPAPKVAPPPPLDGERSRVLAGAEPAAAPRQAAGPRAQAPVAPAAPATTAPGSSAPPTPVPATLASKLRLRKLITGLRRPVLVTAAPGEPDRLYVVEQIGAIRIFEGGALRKQRFLDLEGKVSTGNEQGLLGLAFHPRYASNGKLYINYTDRAGDTRIVEYRVAADRNRVEPSSARELVMVDQPYSNHNGGHLAFAPDGKLYAGLGDGGSAGDPKGRAQNRKLLLGKVLRFDVGDGTTSPGGPELVHWGLRNPWRFAFDSVTGDLFIGDVGQNRYEFVHVVGGEDRRSHNFGWNVVEGNHCYAAATCDRRGLTPATVEYTHDEGCSITGGVVYRGKALPELAGVYFYADYCTSLLRSFRWTRDAQDIQPGSGRPTGSVRDHWDWRGALDRRGELSQISSFGTDGAGELYVVSLTGVVWRLERAP
jgi:glucose/arabinose dehydrogenase